MKKVIVILGPTAVGKTDLGLSLAKKLPGELIACDSRQVYKGLDIGTGKMPSNGNLVNNGKLKKREGYWEIDGIKIWMYDVVDVSKQYTVYDFVKDALKKVIEVERRGKLPIIIGGTGFYLKALIQGLPNLAIPVDGNLRGELEKLTISELQNKLQALSPSRWQKLNDSDKKNPRRLLRSIELISTYPYTRTNYIDNLNSLGYKILKIGIITLRSVINKKIDLRILSRLNQGMIQEVEEVFKKVGSKRLKNLGLEYSIITDFLEGKIKSKDDLIRILQNKIHQYAKRQMTYFKNPNNISEVFWFDITTPDFSMQIEKLVFAWYNTQYATQD